MECNNVDVGGVSEETRTTGENMGDVGAGEQGGRYTESLDLGWVYYGD